MKVNSFILILLFFGVLACKDTGPKDSSPTMGDISIGCDIQLKEMMSQEEDIFELHYKHAKVNLIYRNELSLLKMLREDSVKTAITSRALNEMEINYFKSKKMVTPRFFPFAKGGLALICNKEVNDTGIVYEDFIKLCSGADPSNASFNTVVVEDVNSGIASFLLEKIKAERFTKNVYTLDDKASIFDYLEKNANAIAVVDWSEFSDSDNTIQQGRLKGTKVLGITRPKDSTQLGFVFPEQYLLQDDKYPLSRTYYFVSVSGKSDLGLGFASFVTGDIGQRILLKAGLLPLYQTERWIEIINGDFKVVE
jgi:phosphate transport system substrate-binding protein